MSQGIDGLGFSNTPLSQAGQTGQGEQVTGKSNGQTVQYQPSISSMVADAAEESGQIVQEKASSSLQRREARTKSGSQIRKIMQKYLQSVSAVGQAEKFEKLAKSLRDLGNATPDQIRQKLEEYRRDSEGGDFESGLLLALEELFSTEGANEDLLSAVREVKGERGGELKSFYQENVKSLEDVNDAYQEILGGSDEEKFLNAIDSMISRLGSDLQSQGSSVGGSQIKSTLDTLYNLEVARNTFSAFAQLVEKMQVLFGSNKS